MRIYDDTVPEVDASAGDDDAAIAKWARAHRRRMGLRFLSAAVAVVVCTFAVVRRTDADPHDALVMWCLGGACAGALAIAAAWKLATAPPPKRDTGW